MKYLAAVIVALPVALLATCDIAVLSTNYRGDEDLYYSYWLLLPIFLLIWTGTAFWSSRARSPRTAAARAFLSLIIVGFLTPLAGISAWIAFHDVKDPIGPAWGYFAIGTAVGASVALIAYYGYTSFQTAEGEEVHPAFKSLMWTGVSLMAALTVVFIIGLGSSP